MEIRDSLTVNGKGVFTTQKYKKDDIIFVLSGQVFTAPTRENIHVGNNVHIYDNFGIYTMLNHSFGRYGLTIDGVWKPNTEYADSKTKALLLKEVTQMASDYKDTRGLLLFLLGNENVRVCKDLY